MAKILITLDDMYDKYYDELDRAERLRFVNQLRLYAESYLKQDLTPEEMIRALKNSAEWKTID